MAQHESHNWTYRRREQGRTHLAFYLSFWKSKPIEICVLVLHHHGLSALPLVCLHLAYSPGPHQLSWPQASLVLACLLSARQLTWTSGSSCVVDSVLVVTQYLVFSLACCSYSLTLHPARIVNGLIRAISGS